MFNQIDSSTEDEDDSYKLNINDIPPEVFKYILSHLPHYNDLLTCKLVCKYWYDCVISTLETRARKFKACLRSSNIEWYHCYPLDAPHISPRYSHSCCLHSNLMYIFGGCNNGKTTFNDLWTFDLSQRQWIRPLASGSYPPPKACSSLVSYKDKLILFGGWTQTADNRMHDSWKLFDHLHEFDTRTEKWSLIDVRENCPAMAGHNACIYGDSMIVFGGLHSIDNAPYNFIPSNEVYVYNILSRCWRQVQTVGPKPPGRYGHSQSIINNHLVILGGSAAIKKPLSDFWVLNMAEEPWRWHRVEAISAEQFEKPIIGTNPVCKVDDLFVCLSKNNGPKPLPSLNDPAFFKKLLERHHNESNSSNGKPRYRLLPQPSQSERRLLMNSGRYGLPPSDVKNKPVSKSAHITVTKDELHKKRINPIKLSTQKSHFSPHSNDALCLYTLDISSIITEKKVFWLPQENYVPGPQELLMYSLVVGDSEIIMFGGIRLDNGSVSNSAASNSIYIVTAQKTVI